MIMIMVRLVVMMMAMVTVIAIRTVMEYQESNQINKNGPPEVLWMCADLTCSQQALLECSGTSPC